MSLKIRDEITLSLRELQRRLANPRPILQAGAEVVQDVDRRARRDAALRRMPWSPTGNRAAELLAKYRAQQREWMRQLHPAGWPQQRPVIPGQTTPLTAHSIEVAIAPESRSAVAAAKPQIVAAIQAKVDEIVRGQ